MSRLIAKSAETDLRRRLTLLSKEIKHEVRHLNSGGCCVYAALVGRVLVRHGITTVGIVVPDVGDQRSVSDIRYDIERRKGDLSNIYNWSKGSMTFRHVGLRIHWNSRRASHYDLNGFTPASRRRLNGFRTMDGVFTIEELSAFGLQQRNSSYWNRRFDRQQIGTMRDVITRFLAT